MVLNSTHVDVAEFMARNSIESNPSRWQRVVVGRPIQFAAFAPWTPFQPTEGENPEPKGSIKSSSGHVFRDSIR